MGTKKNSKSDPLDLRRIKAESSKAESSAGEEFERAAALTPRTVIFPISYTDPEGVRHRDSLESHILGGDERFGVSRMTASLLGGVKWDECAPALQDRAWALSWLTHCFDNAPKWFLRWITEDDFLLLTVYQEVQQHELRYFRGNDAEGGVPAEEQRIQLDSPFAATTTEE